MICGGELGYGGICDGSFGTIMGQVIEDYFFNAKIESKVPPNVVSNTTNVPVALECTSEPQYYKESVYSGPNGEFVSYEIPYCYNNELYILTSSFQHPFRIFSTDVKKLLFEQDMVVGERLSEGIEKLVSSTVHNILGMPKSYCTFLQYRIERDVFSAAVFRNIWSGPTAYIK